MTENAANAGIALYLMVLAVLAVRVIMQRRPPGSTAAWLLSLIVLPYVGVVLYLLIGERALGRRRAARALAMRGVVEERVARLIADAASADCQVAPQWAAIRDLAASAAGSAALGGNALSLLEEADAILRAIIEDIDRAQHRCLLEFYIWNPGGTADDVARALIRAAERGVLCQVLLDDVGSADFFRSDWPARMRAAGIELCAALPAGLVRALFRRIDLRLHRKLVIVDSRVAYTGSLNMVDPRCFKQTAGVGYWVDAMVRVEGPVVEALALLFAWDWAMEGRDTLLISDAPQRAPQTDGNALVVQTVPSGPSFEAPAIVQLLLSALYGARSELTMTTPYFVPDEPLIGALRAAAQRGVRVRLIVPAKVDSFFARHASRAFFDDLLDAGVEILLFTGGLLHTKSVVVDRELALFGTLNLDLRSFMLNFEVTLIVYGRSFAEPLAELQARYAAQSVPLELTVWRRRPMLQRFFENLVQLSSPLL